MAASPGARGDALREARAPTLLRQAVEAEGHPGLPQVQAEGPLNGCSGDTSRAAAEEEAREAEREEDIFFDPSLFLNTSYVLRDFSLSADVALQLSMLPSASTDFDLTGQIPWPAAGHLARVLIERPQFVAGRHVVELGSGIGLSGLTAAHFCDHLTLTDGSDVVMEVLQMNVDRNLPNIQLSNKAVEVQCRKLSWGHKGEADNILMSLAQPPSVVIGADICYQEEFLDPLFKTVGWLASCHKTWSERVANNGGHAQAELFAFYLAYCERNKRTTRLLMQTAEACRFSVEEVKGTQAILDGGTLHACVYVLTWSAS